MELAKEIQMRNVIERLARLEREVSYLKNHVEDIDSILTPEEEKLLEDSYENEKAGKLLSSKEIETELAL